MVKVGNIKGLSTTSLQRYKDQKIRFVIIAQLLFVLYRVEGKVLLNALKAGSWDGLDERTGMVKKKMRRVGLKEGREMKKMGRVELKD